MIHCAMALLGEKLERPAVVLFLTRFKAMASEDELVVFARDKYMETLAELGMLPSQAEEAILSLTIENYYKGLGPGDREGEEVCEFGMMIEEKEIYIKLLTNSKHKNACCFSFHTAERPITYPYAGDPG